MNHAPGPSVVERAGKSQRLVHDAWPTLSVREANNAAIWRLLRAIVYGMLLTRGSCDLVFSPLGGDPGSMSVGAVLNVLAIAIAFVLLAERPLTASFSVIGIWGPFLLVAFASSLYAPDFFGAVRLALVLLSYWSFFIIPFFLWRSQADVSRFVMLVIGSSAIPSLYALVDISRGLHDLTEFRLQSTFSHPNIYAFYLVLLLGLAFYVRSSRIIRVTPQVRLLVTLYIPYLVVLLILTKTRSAWIAGGLLFLVYAIRVDRKFLAGFLLIPLLVVADPSVIDRLTDVTEPTEIDSFTQLNESTRLNSYEWRQILWESAIPQIIEKPLLGHGLVSFKPSTPSFFPLVGPEGIDGHNVYLQTSFEMGLVGVFAWVWLLGSVVRQILKGRRYDPPGVLIILWILIGYVLECYSDNMHFYLSFNWYFWFVIGTICAWVYNEERAPRPQRGARTRYRLR
jgi:putative inorganic carbon (HCO3(-)) transporter